MTKVYRNAKYLGSEIQGRDNLYVLNKVGDIEVWERGIKGQIIRAVMKIPGGGPVDLIYPIFQTEDGRTIRGGSPQTKTVSAQKVNQAKDQKRLGTKGRFGRLNPCYACGKSAGQNYFSHPMTDSVSPSGDSWGDCGLVLCKKCAVATEHMKEPREFELWVLKNYPEVHATNYHHDQNGRTPENCPACLDSEQLLGHQGDREALAEKLALMDIHELQDLVNRVCNRFERGVQYRKAQDAWVAMDVTLVSLRRGEQAPKFDKSTFSKGPR